MKKIALTLALALLTGCAGFLPGPRHLYLAVDGHDSNPGTPRKPFATLESARDAIREMPPSARTGGVTVLIAAGTYELRQTFALDARDSGREGAPVVYRAAPGAEVRLVAGRNLPPSAFESLKDPGTLDRLEPSARGKVLQCHLSELGISDYGQTSHRVRNELVDGAMHTVRSPMPELFFNDEPLPFSRWPNSDWATYGRVIEAGSVPRWQEKPDRPGTLVYTGSRPERWTKAGDIYIQGYFAHDWFDDILKVAKLDVEQKTMAFTTPHMYGLKPNKRYRALGLLEEIDQPGEWMIGNREGVLYLYPPQGMQDGRLVLSMLETPMIRMTGAQHIVIRELTLEATRGTCIDIAGGADNLVTSCTLRNIGGDGVRIRPAGHAVTDGGALHVFPEETGDPLEDGRRNGVANCDLYNIGATGISVIGGDRATLTPGEHYAVNNDIHHYARRQRTNQPAINLNGVGHRAAHNFIHDAPHTGLFYSGNDHVIEHNEATRLCQETGDVGAFYSGRNWTYRGNVVRYNFIHHISGPGRHGSMAVYLDDSHSSTHIYGNVFYKVQYAAFIGGGHDNVVENNLFVDSGHAVHIDNRSENWAHKYQVRGGDHRMYAKLEEVNPDQPPWSTRYPELARILEGDPHKPGGNKVLNNICVRSGWIHGPKSLLEIGPNLVTDEDPGFIDVENMNFALENLDAVRKVLPDLEPVPFEEIGLCRKPTRSDGAAGRHRGSQ